ncbi:MAG: phosphoribosylformylglycinamidine synthase subunit PurL [Bacteroidia bacterium]|nr:phosphoribosylformylglycinamidine synthase subunit PurL [Bacteroidia bacterium]MDW8333099.1 phosphoribosylformylglycinamidine synthase subunit PurL [Bacteroidia bacterium]
MNQETALKLGLTAEEYDKIVEILGREPNFTELSVYSVMWSEHCSYKNSILWLKTLPRTSSKMLAVAGEENAGIMEVADGWAVVFKIESHNHPSAIEPYQGAATGVGGIHRDIFTMGARPVAALNSLRFGMPEEPSVRRLLDGVVAGIGGYGNAFGVPTVGGEIYFDPSYTYNPLVNAMSVGLVRTDAVVSARAGVPGNPVYIVGSATGRDGIHGAVFASQDLGRDSAEQLPAVQIGDPFQEKLLLEATLEAVATGAVAGMQDMGAAGIACSTSEMSARSGVGMDIFLDRVPVRASGMKPFELLLSESQERMLVVAQADKAALVERTFAKWDLPCVRIGTVTDGGMLRYFYDGELVAQIPAQSLVLGGGAPVYRREYVRPSYMQSRVSDFSSLVPAPFVRAARFLIRRPNIASRRCVYERYDSMVGAGTMTTNVPASAAVVKIPGTNKALAMTVDCNARRVFLDPYEGAAYAVAEAARNLVCTGARPLGVTNCLNFGNPYNPEVYYTFVEAIRGMGEACKAFDVPVTGGNVSFYNQYEGAPVFPTPTIGMVGCLEQDRLLTLALPQSDALLFMLGEVSDDLGASEYLEAWHGVRLSVPPKTDLSAEKRLQNCILALNDAKILLCANDVSDGGLWIALFESAAAAERGFSVHTPYGVRKDGFWFGEAGGRVVVAVAAEHESHLREYARSFGVPVLLLGRVWGRDAVVDGECVGTIAELKAEYETALPQALGES